MNWVKDVVKTFDMFLVYSVLILSFPHFSCTSWLFPKCKFAFFKVLAKLSPFLECFFPLETLLKPKATPIKKKNHLLQETSGFIMIYFVLFFTWHMCYFYTDFYSVLMFKGLIVQVVASSIIASWWVETWLICLYFCHGRLYTMQCGKINNYGLWLMEHILWWETETVIEQANNKDNFRLW